MAARGANLRHQAERTALGVPPLLVAAERIAATVAQGVHGRRRVGPGETFWQFRRYQPGDPTPSIDWRQSAKSDKVYVRQMEWEAAQSLWLWHDNSPSMAWHSSQQLPSKGFRAGVLVLALSLLLVRGGERIALLGGDQPPMTGQSAVDRLTLLLTKEPEGGGDGLPPYRPLPRYAELVLISDFLSPLEEIHDSLAPFAARGVSGHLLQVLDPAEEVLPYRGRVRFEGLEGETPWLLSRAEAVREDYGVQLARHRAGLAALARGYGWSFTGHRSDHSAESALLCLYNALARHPGA